MKRMQRILSGWLAICLTVSMLPVQVFARDNDPEEVAVEVVEEAAQEALTEEVVEEVAEEAAEEIVEEVPQETVSASKMVKASAIDETSINEDNACGEAMSWSFDNLSGTLIISGTGKMYNYSSDDDEVTTAPWAEFVDRIVKVNVSDGVEYIGRNAFSGCKQLSDVFLPASVTKLGNYAFFGCIGLGKIDLPDNIENLGQFTFWGSGLTDIKIPQSVMEIDYGTFYYCEKLTSVDLPKGLAKIGDDAFVGCINLAEIAIPENVTSIGSSAFADCEKITSIAIPNGITQINDNTFGGCTGLIEISIGNNVESIQENAFNQCWSLTKVEFWDKLANIESRGFFNCYNLTEIRFTGNAPAIASDAFFEVTAAAYYPSDNTTWNENVFRNYGGNLTWKPHSHSYGDWCQTVAPTQNMEGEERRDCMGCNYYETRVLEKLPDSGDICEHHYTAITTNPTCTEQGFTTYICRCNHSYVDDYVDAIGHSFGEWYETGMATVEMEGEERRDCNNCESFETRTINKVLNGTCGEGVFWTLNNEGVLTISGSGEMVDFVYYTDDPDYSDTRIVPWAEYRDDIKTIIIEENVVDLGNYAFFLCQYVEEIYFYASEMNDMPSAREIFGNVGTCGDGVCVTFGKNVTRVPAYLFGRSG